MSGLIKERLYQLLPAIYRIRDAEQGEALRALFAIIESELLAIEEDIHGLYDNWFIETCEEWVIPYIGDLLGVRLLHAANPDYSQRAYVANTLAYRRRKGTATVLEQLARDVTGWPARAVEFFQLVATTQDMNHVRPSNMVTPDLRDASLLELLDSPFDTIAHTAEVRRIATDKGKYNIPNIGIFLWRLLSLPITDSPAYKVDSRRYLFSPPGNDTQLFTLPETEEEITHLAESINVPMPISRRMMSNNLDTYYGENRSLSLHVDGQVVDRDKIVVCDLSDKEEGNWNERPQDSYAIDPVLGRIALPENEPIPTAVHVTFHYGFSAQMAGGEYERASTFSNDLKTIEYVRSAAKEEEQPGKSEASAHSTIQKAIDELMKFGGDGVAEIADNGRYEEALNVHVPAGKHIEVRAADGCRPTLALKSPLPYCGGHMGIGAELL